MLTIRGLIHYPANPKPAPVAKKYTGRPLTWTPAMDAWLIEHYATADADTIAGRFDKPIASIYARAALLGLRRIG